MHGILCFQAGVSFGRGCRVVGPGLLLINNWKVSAKKVSRDLFDFKTNWSISKQTLLHVSYSK